MDLKEGDRIELVQMADDPNPIPSGSQGTVKAVFGPHPGPRDVHYQVAVEWDNKRSLLLVVPPDIYRKL